MPTTASSTATTCGIVYAESGDLLPAGAHQALELLYAGGGLSEGEEVTLCRRPTGRLVTCRSHPCHHVFSADDGRDTGMDSPASPDYAPLE